MCRNGSLSLLVVLLLVLVLDSQARSSNPRPTGAKIEITLTNGWRFRETGKVGWHAAAVPGCVHTDLLANRIHGYFSPASTVTGHVQAGKLVALAITDEKRSSFLPDLPTMTEAGVPDCVSVLWFGISAPAGTPQPIIDKLNEEIARSLGAADVKERFAAAGMEPVGGTPAKFAAFLREETAKWAEVIRAANIRAE